MSAPSDDAIRADADLEARFGSKAVLILSHITAWIFPTLMLAIVAQVFLRKAGVNQAWLDDAQWWLYGFAMLVGFGYAIVLQSHVRVDIFYEHFDQARKSRIEIFGLGWLLLPFLGIMGDTTFHFAVSSVIAGEGSDSPNGLHGLYILKTTIPILFGFAILGACSVLRHHLAKLGHASLLAFVIGAFPAVWFLMERFALYVMWWGHRLTTDLQPRRIIREDIFEWTVWIGLALTLLLALIVALTARRGVRN